MTEPKYWRIRMKYGGYEELVRDAWDRNEVGIWYGAWTAEELASAIEIGSPLKYLSKVNRKRGLDWDVPSMFLSLAQRFSNIRRNDWVFVHFDGALHLAHVCSEVMSSAKHPLNREGEIFKFRRINRKKSFSLDSLPDAFRLLPAAGRGNVFQPRGCGELIKLLGEAADGVGVMRQLESKVSTNFWSFSGLQVGNPSVKRI